MVMVLFLPASRLFGDCILSIFAKMTLDVAYTILTMMGHNRIRGTGWRADDRPR
jgi:hypothetical protein